MNGRLRLLLDGFLIGWISTLFIPVFSDSDMGRVIAAKAYLIAPFGEFGMWKYIFFHMVFSMLIAIFVMMMIEGNKKDRMQRFCGMKSERKWDKKGQSESADENR